jgi:hypothetical protein
MSEVFVVIKNLPGGRMEIEQAFEDQKDANSAAAKTPLLWVKPLAVIPSSSHTEGAGSGPATAGSSTTAPSWD